LPAAGVQWWRVAVEGRFLLVTGSARTGTRCDFFLVQIRNLKGRGPYLRPCSKPPVSTHAVVPAVAYSRSSQYDAVTVAGKVVMHYKDASDTRPQWTTYGRSLWLYDVATSHGPEVLRFDAHTGALLQRTAMPHLFRPVMVANAVGLWLDPATNGGIDGSRTAPVLHVSFRASKPVAVHRGGHAALWMAASAHAVWFEQIAGSSSVSIWQIDGTRVRLLARPRTIGFLGAYGGGRVWELTYGEGNDRLVRIDPDSGALMPTAQFPPTATSGDASMTVAGRDVFVLDGQKLYRYHYR
jgi:hypothetical protein